MIRSLLTTAVKELEQEIKDSASGQEKEELLAVLTEICDMLLMNQNLNNKLESPVAKVLLQRRDSSDLSKSINKAFDRSTVLRQWHGMQFF